MDKQLTGVLTLLRSALNGESLTVPHDFDWEQANQSFFQHHLVGLAFRGAMNCGISKTSPGFCQLTALFCKQIQEQRKQMQELQDVYDLLEEQAIDYIPLKGAVLKELYPQEEMRFMGDADLLIKIDQYPRIQKLLSQRGMQCHGRTDHHFEWQGENLALELHISLMLSSDLVWFDYYRNIWEKALLSGHGNQYRLSAEDHFIYLVAHFAKHFCYGGITAKPLCDFWLYRRKYPHMDEDYLCRELEKLRLLPFYRKLMQLMQVWFAGAQPTPADEQLTRMILKGGIMGEEESAAAMNVLRSRKDVHTGSESKARAILLRAFPPFSAMVRRYRFLEAYPLLLPVAWLLRVGSIVRKPDKIRRNIQVTKYIREDSQKLAGELQAGLELAGLEIM